MHNHNNHSDNKDGEHKGMMWMMALCCLLPAVFLFGGLEFFKSIGYNWVGLGLIGLLLLIYFGRNRCH
ncbi:MAG: hypothetical protein AAB946_03325 [Patescibacteria group bacterium]